MQYTPTDALRLLAGVTRKRLYEAMKNGELSYVIKDKGRLIDASELARVFGDKFTIQETQENISKVSQETKRNTQETLETQFENRLLQQQINDLEKRLLDKENENKKLWENLEREAQERNKLLDTLNKQALLLTDQRERQPDPVQTVRKKILGIF
jgi:septal ring factor EnvC (AmiA/AmiB activator)